MTSFATQSTGYDFFRPSSSLDLQHQFFEDEESSILDDNILDSAVAMSPQFSQRRDSFADTTAFFSPKEQSVGWADFDDKFMGVPDRNSTSFSTNPFIEQSNNPFMRLEAAQAATYGQQTSAWPMVEDPGAVTPTAVYDGFPSEYDNRTPSSFLPTAPVATATFQAAVPSTNPLRPGSVYVPSAASTATNVSVPPSPHPTKDWMSSMAQQSSESLAARSIPKRMRQESPPRPSSTLHMRRDGIRKKNARFEIPPERNLNNIDRLISESNDDQEIKELKQQKRLLRNRQAALDSRQRKKQHTERLEDEKKQFTAMINELEEQLADMRIRESEYLHEKDEWHSQQQQCKQYIETLVLEKEEMVRAHTLETGDLRKKNAYLTEHIQKMENTAMSAAPSSSGFSAEFSSEMDGLTMDESPWDSLFVNDFGIDNTEQPTETSLVVAKKPEKPSFKDEDKPAASGLLLMLLLFGAFVASKSSSPTPPSIPRVPDDIRAASATVLDNIFKDAGLQTSDSRIAGVSRVEALEPAPSGMSWSSAPTGKTTMSGSELASMSAGPSTLDVLHGQLAGPTREQEGEQLFSLSAEQYNGVTSQDFLHSRDAPTPPRRNLGETLAAMRGNDKGSAAEVYTRSLMWDKIPTEVVRDFAKMVAEINDDHRGTVSAKDGI
ncbi:hypothetical protein L228DRAFT_267813 [Xylona heveae TC161]|uniref:BZIP domain-containing protein n=1 Tax=Xylona heveae (strain CBS 132557 / TC161) TaxID=1328760 RepID=A0A165HQZ9_XYLHT|nr:hypothetical protein L228DRAFT_267813 [Xylona heveae TC161]KZF23852.1 hypothetical protein L228DRAFT_267813 [Xylona heveae TC161]